MLARKATDVSDDVQYEREMLVRKATDVPEDVQNEREKVLPGMRTPAVFTGECVRPTPS